MDRRGQRGEVTRVLPWILSDSPASGISSFHSVAPGSCREVVPRQRHSGN